MSTAIRTLSQQHQQAVSKQIENSSSIKEKTSSHASKLKGKNKKSKSIAAPFRIVCQYKDQLVHSDLFVFCEDCRIYICIQCDSIYHSSNAEELAGHVRGPVIANSNSSSSPSAKGNDDNMMPSLDPSHFQQSFDNGPISNCKSPTRAVEDGNKMRAKEEQIGEPGKSFLLINEREIIQVQSVQDFVKRLGCSDKETVKVVSIFGNTGDGKSHTLNHIFFDGKEVFRTSPSQISCTLGVWAAYNPQWKVIVLDTEGLLGTSSNHNQRTRLLLKVMAISDVVIYRTRAERLHSDMFLFLNDASKAFNSYFKKELQAASERCKIEGPLSQLGPYVVIFHETQHTNVLKAEQNPADILRKAFDDQRCGHDAFSGLKYVGTRTQTNTDFSELSKIVKKRVKASDVRSFRSPNVIFQVLQMLNNKFGGHIENTIAEAFPDQYFTCSEKCRSCGARCRNSTNHHLDNIPHSSNTKCRFQHQYQNRIFICKVCHDKGETVIVVPKVCSSSDSSWLGIAKYAWSGYVIECVNCGVIYQSRKYWYGNRDPNECMQTEIRHVWPGTVSTNNGSLNVGQKLLDSITYLSSTVSSVSSAPSKSVSSWMADWIAPPYWIPNCDIIKCYKCGYQFDVTDAKHHCRSCGQGFCEKCSDFFRPVPERGWGDKPVRVCESCVNVQSESTKEAKEQEVMARKVGEMLHSTIETVVAVMEYPKGLIKDSARPSYWVPDEHIIQCHICHSEFTPKLSRHHCRACGQGVCQDCSPSEKPVPARGWPQPVRVCKLCVDSGELDC